MYRIALVNMPFTKLRVPSIGLTQVRSAVARWVGPGVQSDIWYVNHDVARYMGVDLYTYVTDAKGASNSGLGDWFFRQVAFPDLPDNTEAYLTRYFPRHDPESEELKRELQVKRAGLDELFDRVIDEYSLLDANLVGLTSMFAQTVACLALARKIKARKPEMVIAIGGANCETPMGQVLARRANMVDFVFSGPALKSFPTLVRHLMEGRRSECHCIAGVFSRKNVAFCPPPLGEEVDIDENLELDYDSYLESLEKHFPGQEFYPALLFETSRGCWWGERSHCTFCGLNGSTMKARTMAVDKAVDHLQSMFRYADRVKFYEGVDNIMPRHYPKEVFSRLNPPGDISIFYEVKSDLTEEDVQILARANINRIQPGVESLATSTLKLMKKGSTAFQGISLLKNCAMHRVRPTWNLLVGFPGERSEVYEKYEQDLPLLVHLPPPTGVFPVRFDRYSPYFMKAVEYGLDLRPLDYYELTYPYNPQELRELAYYFRDQNLSADYFIDMARWIDRVQRRTDEWASRWRQGRDGMYPFLYFEPNGGRLPKIFDSRTLAIVHHEVSDLEHLLLQQLTKPLSLELLASRLPEHSDSRVEADVHTLRDRGLLFEEGGRYLSLVHDVRPPEMDWLRF
jgi:ribosomal peptide maturation radical SAM protein 1